MRERKREEADKKKKRIAAVGNCSVSFFYPSLKEAYSTAVIGCSKRRNFSSLLNLGRYPDFKNKRRK